MKFILGVILYLSVLNAFLVQNVTAATTSRSPASCRTEPPALYNGEITVINGSEGGQVNYECAKGFEMVIQGSVTCQNGEWIGNPPSCKQTGCYVPWINRGMISQGIFKEGQLPLQLSPGTIVNNNEEHTLNCHQNDNGNRVRYSTVKCKDGSWEKFLVCQERFCRYVGQPPKILNGKSTTFYGKYVIYNCHKGFNQTNYGNIVCTNNGWAGVPATCTENNCTVPVINNGKFIERKAKWNSTSLVNYEYQEVKPGKITEPGKSLYVLCDEDYFFGGSKNYTGPATCRAGEFEPKPTCLPADVVFEDRREEAGLDKDKEITNTVSRNGKCEPIPMEKDVIVYYDYNERYRAFFVCKGKNKKIVGFSDLTCLPNGEWSGMPPKCVPIECPKFKPEPGMFISYSQNVEVGSWATFHCYSSKNEMQDKMSRCLENGKWSAPLPSCAQNVSQPDTKVQPSSPKEAVDALNESSNTIDKDLHLENVIRQKEHDVKMRVMEVEMRKMEAEMEYRRKEHEMKMKVYAAKLNYYNTATKVV